MKTILEENRILEFYATEGGTICDKMASAAHKRADIPAAALIIFLAKRCQLIWSNFRSMMTSSKAQQCAKLPAWMFGGPYFASGRGVNVYGAGRSNVKSFNNTKKS